MRYWWLLFVPFLGSCSALATEVLGRPEVQEIAVGVAAEAVKGVATGLWDPERLWQLGGTALSAILGTNWLRNRARKSRGEPVDAAPAKPA